MSASNKIRSCFKSTFCCPFADLSEADEGQQRVLEGNQRCPASTDKSPQADDLLHCSLELPSRADWSMSYQKPLQAKADLTLSELEEELNWSLKRNKELTCRVHELEDFLCLKVGDAGSQSLFRDKLRQQLERSVKEKRQLEGRAQKAEENIRDLKHEIAVLQKRLQQAENPFPGLSSPSRTPPVPPPPPLPPATSSIRSCILVTQRPVSVWNALQIPEAHGEGDSLASMSGGSLCLKPHAMSEVLEMIRHGVLLKPVTSSKKAVSSVSANDPELSPAMAKCIQEGGQQEIQAGSQNPQPDVPLEAFSCPSPPGQGHAQGGTGPEETLSKGYFWDHKSPYQREVESDPLISQRADDIDEGSAVPVTIDLGFEELSSVTSSHNCERAPTSMGGSVDNGSLPSSKGDYLESRTGSCREELLKTPSEWGAKVMEACMEFSLSPNVSPPIDHKAQDKAEFERAWSNVSAVIEPVGSLGMCQHSQSLSPSAASGPGLTESSLLKEGDKTDLSACPESCQVMGQTLDFPVFSYPSVTNESKLEEEQCQLFIPTEQCTDQNPKTTSVGWMAIHDLEDESGLKKDTADVLEDLSAHPSSPHLPF
ncbi:uncharacterized protein LOC115092678 isoform X2 [Rhinatrema bivittatum]|uniref:uncharacterized protein LOC115092678 isoform X2 n=1 Tax=Rhinatrema bivittatum TaxID=194408 RepID=UPI00112E818A|nr:uncharacterized protein LOC115092678 isoform X2 [Rhinatrema bivittatum]